VSGYIVTHHAVDRYVSRVKPHLGRLQAEQELTALLELAAPILKPDWYRGIGPADHWLAIAPDCVAVVHGRRVTTVVNREVDGLRRPKKKRPLKATNDGFYRKRGRKIRHPARPRAQIEDEAWPT
jgi:hypothetical protein